MGVPEIEQVASDVLETTRSLEELLAKVTSGLGLARLEELQFAGANATMGSLLGVLQLTRTIVEWLHDIGRQHIVSWESYKSDREHAVRKLHGNIEKGARAAQALIDRLVWDDVGSAGKQNVDTCELSSHPALQHHSSAARRVAKCTRRLRLWLVGRGVPGSTGRYSVHHRSQVGVAGSRVSACARLHHVLLCGAAAAAGSLVLGLARITRLGKVRQLVSACAPYWPVMRGAVEGACLGMWCRRGAASAHQH